MLLAYQSTLDETKSLEQMTLASTWDFWSFAEIQTSLKEPNHFLLYKPQPSDTSHWQGFILFQKGPYSSELFYIYVAPEFRGRGLGEELFQGMVVLLKEDPQQEGLFLEVRPSNTKAIKLYERLGMTLISQRPGYYPDGEAANIFELKW